MDLVTHHHHQLETTTNQPTHQVRWMDLQGLLMMISHTAAALQNPTELAGQRSSMHAAWPGQHWMIDDKKKQLSNRGSRDESQWIAVCKLLCQAQHPGPQVSRLRTIPHSDVGYIRGSGSKGDRLNFLYNGSRLEVANGWCSRSPLPAKSTTAP